MNKAELIELIADMPDECEIGIWQEDVLLTPTAIDTDGVNIYFKDSERVSP